MKRIIALWLSTIYIVFSILSSYTVYGGVITDADVNSPGNKGNNMLWGEIDEQSNKENLDQLFYHEQEPDTQEFEVQEINNIGISEDETEISDICDRTVIVKFKDKDESASVNAFSVYSSAVDEASNILAIDETEFCEELNAAQIVVEDERDVDELISSLENNSEIEYAEVSGKVSACSYNDPMYSKNLQWGMDASGVASAKFLTPEIRKNLSKITVAVIDSGIDYNHEDISKEVIQKGYDFVGSDTLPQDEMYHGTSVAGVIGATADNGIGIAGVASGVKLMPIRVLDRSGFGNEFNLAKAIVFAVNNGADIINMSLGIENIGNVVKQALQYAIDKEVLIAVAMGNGYNKNAQSPLALFDGVIPVGAAIFDGEKFIEEDYSNYNANNSNRIIYAPGSYIMSTRYRQTKTDDYDYQSGTSLATPFVSGMLALLKAEDMTASSEQLKNKLYENTYKQSNRYVVENGKVVEDKNIEMKILDENSTQNDVFFKRFNIDVTEELLASSKVRIWAQNQIGILDNTANYEGELKYYKVKYNEKTGKYSTIGSKYNTYFTLKNGEAEVELDLTKLGGYTGKIAVEVKEMSDCAGAVTKVFPLTIKIPVSVKVTIPNGINIHPQEITLSFFSENKSKADDTEPSYNLEKRISLKYNETEKAFVTDGLSLAVNKYKILYEIKNEVDNTALDVFPVKAQLGEILDLSDEASRTIELELPHNSSYGLDGVQILNDTSELQLNDAGSNVFTKWIKLSQKAEWELVELIQDKSKAYIDIYSKDSTGMLYKLNEESKTVLYGGSDTRQVIAINKNAENEYYIRIKYTGSCSVKALDCVVVPIKLTNVPKNTDVRIYAEDKNNTSMETNIKTKNGSIYYLPLEKGISVYFGYKMDCTDKAYVNVGYLGKSTMVPSFAKRDFKDTATINGNIEMNIISSSTIKDSPTNNQISEVGTKYSGKLDYIGDVDDFIYDIKKNGDFKFDLSGDLEGVKAGVYKINSDGTKTSIKRFSPVVDENKLSEKINLTKGKYAVSISYSEVLESKEMDNKGYFITVAGDNDVEPEKPSGGGGGGGGSAPRPVVNEEEWTKAADGLYNLKMTVNPRMAENMRGSVFELKPDKIMGDVKQIDISIPANVMTKINEGSMEIYLDCGAVKFVFPSKTLFTGDLKIKIIVSENTLIGTNRPVSPIYDITMTLDGEPISSFRKDISMSLKIQSEKITKSDKVSAYYYDESQKEWIKMHGGKIDGESFIVGANHLTKFTVMENEEIKNETVTEPSIVFYDIDGNFAEKYIIDMAEKGILNGDNGMFFPDENIRRSEFATIITNLGNLKADSTKLNPFIDVNISDWYYNPVKATYDCGIVKGRGENTFEPDNLVTREEIVSMAIRLYEAYTGNKAPIADLNFTDTEDIDQWAADSVQKALGLGIVSGRQNNTFGPKDFATRAETAVIASKLFEKMTRANISK